MVNIFISYVRSYNNKVRKKNICEQYNVPYQNKTLWLPLKKLNSFFNLINSVVQDVSLAADSLVVGHEIPRCYETLGFNIVHINVCDRTLTFCRLTATLMVVPHR